MSTVDLFFYVFAGLASVLALRVVTTKNPVSGAFSLVLMFFCVSAIYALLEAHFLAAIQVLVYAGAVMVLFVFVIMLLNADMIKTEVKKSVSLKIFASIVLFMGMGFLGWCIRNGQVFDKQGQFTPQKIEELGGNSRVLSEVLFSDFILPFELTSVILLVGIVGSVALAKRNKTKKLKES